MARFLSSRLRGWLTAPGHSSVRLFLLLLLLTLRLRTLLSFVVVSHHTLRMAVVILAIDINSTFKGKLRSFVGKMTDTRRNGHTRS